MMLLAVHLSDGVLTGSWLIAGFIVAALLVASALYKIDEDEIPTIALLTAAFFVSSLIHVRLGAMSVHLLLTGLLGAMLGRRSPLAISVGLALQAVLLGHGGYSALGLNIVIMSLPALGSWFLFAFLRRLVPVFWAGLVTGSLAVVLTCTLNALVLVVAGIEDFSIIAGAGFIAHLPLAVIEGLVLGTTVAYLVKVKPQLLHGHRPPG